MSTLQTVIQRGTAASQPAANTVPVGTLYFQTDTFFIQRSNGTTWDSYGPVLLIGDSGSGGTVGLVPAPASGDTAAGKFLKADGTWKAPSTTSPLERHVASNSATLDFTSFVSSSYDDYLIVGDGIVPVSSAVSLMIQVGTGVGPTWDTGNNYEWTSLGFSSNGLAINDNGSTGAGARILNSMGNTAGWSGNFSITAFQLNSTTLRKSFSGTTYFVNSTPRGLNSSFGAQWITTGTAVSGLRFLMSSGNISVGNISIYGIKNS